MLKEGWDVTNLYTIIPLRAANARTLDRAEHRARTSPALRQTHRRGAVDRLNIVAHDRFQEIVDEANNPNSPIRLKQLVLDEADFVRKTVTVVRLRPSWAASDCKRRRRQTGPHRLAPRKPQHLPIPTRCAWHSLAYDAFRKLAREPDKVPSVSYLVAARSAGAGRARGAEPVSTRADGIRGRRQARARYGGGDRRDRETNGGAYDRNSPHYSDAEGRGEGRLQDVHSRFSGMRYAAPSDELWAKYLRTDRVDVIGLSQGNLLERRLEDYVVSGLIDFPDIAYDEYADLLYELAGQVVRHLLTYLSEKDAGQVLALHQREIARAVHAQMQDHFWMDDTVEYHHEVRQGFTELKESAYTALREAAPRLSCAARR